MGRALPAFAAVSRLPPSRKNGGNHEMDQRVKGLPRPGRHTGVLDTSRFKEGTSPGVPWGCASSRRSRHTLRRALSQATTGS